MVRSINKYYDEAKNPLETELLGYRTLRIIPHYQPCQNIEGCQSQGLVEGETE